MNSSSNVDHLSQELILLVLDDELTPAQRLECESHLAVCEICREKLSSLGEFSLQLESAVHSVAVPQISTGRLNLEKALQSSKVRESLLPQPGKVMRRFGWGMGIAATLAFGVLMAPKHDLSPQPGLADAAQVSTASPSTIEVDGETFLSVPYSNADLSTAVPHIVQMQVPISSLTDIGIVLEPVMNRVSSGSDSERSVLADVLVGADGQPRGVHVLGFE